MGETACLCPDDLGKYANLLFTTLEVGFRLALPGRSWPAVHSNHTPHHDQMRKTAFLSDDDEVVVDAPSVIPVTAPATTVPAIQRRTRTAPSILKRTAESRTGGNSTPRRVARGTRRVSLGFHLGIGLCSRIVGNGMLGIPG